jgi:hypothetical protein
MVDDKTNDDKQSTSFAGHVAPWRCAGAIRSALPNVACPVLLRKPLDAASGRLLAPYCSHGHHINSKQNNNVKCDHFAGRFDGRGGAPVLYCVHRPMEEVHGFPKSH